MSADAMGLRAVTASLLVNISFSLIKIVTGIVGNSYAMVADGIESAADVFSSLVVWSGLRISTTPPDENHPYGHGKAESLAGFVAALALGFSAVLIAWNSMHEILQPGEPPKWFTLAVMVGVIVIKGVLWRTLTHAGERIDSTALKNDAWHHLSDAITSLAVLIGLLVAIVGGKDYAQADDIAALLVCGFILYNAYHLIQPSIDEIMDAAAPAELIARVREESGKVPGVCGIDDLRIRKSGLGYLVDIHVEVKPTISVHDGHEIAHAVKDYLLALNCINIVDVTVHIEPHAQ